jgi:predicted nucleotidyltransferase
MLSAFQKQQILQTLAPYQPEKVSVFGSYARGEETATSDLDLLVKFNTKISFLQLVMLEQSLTDLLHIPTELITENALRNQKLKKYILQDLVSL